MLVYSERQNKFYLDLYREKQLRHMHLVVVIVILLQVDFKALQHSSLAIEFLQINFSFYIIVLLLLSYSILLGSQMSLFFVYTVE